MKNANLGTFLLFIALLGIAPPLIMPQEIIVEPENLKGIPADLQLSLIDELRRFVLAQKNGQWDQVSGLLGDIRMSSYHPLFYTSKHKQCLIEQMKSFRMVGFKVTGIYVSSGTITLPENKKWWFLAGEVEFAEGRKPQGGGFPLIAYRNKNGWYFTPQNYDNDWLKQRITEQELMADQSNNLLAQQEHGCPLEIVDLSVKIDPQNLSSRIVRFHFRNKSNKTVTGISFSLFNENGSTGIGMPMKIVPGEKAALPKDLSYPAFRYCCLGEEKNRLLIDSINFEDGTTWESRRNKPSVKKPN
jgi:hypothetical protein